MDRWRTDGRTVLVSALIFVATFAAFWPVFQNGFVHFDDPDYLIDNPHVQGGITTESLAWAFSSGHAANWHPITWVSHMLDCAMFGLNPVGHHFINLLIHAINGVLLLLALRKLTGAFWPSAFVAALFALHPLRVESVAWASERKDVLSGFFFFLTLLAYAAYAKQRGAGSDSSPPREPGTKAPNARTLLSYIAALVFFALGLMSKPMLVTVPFLLLLLDCWPLQRIRGWDPRAATRLLVEKAPFLVLAIVSSFITIAVQNSGGTVVGFGLPLESRVANALISYWQYIPMFVWPSKLAFFYPHPAGANPALLSWITWKSVLAILLVFGITAAAIRIRKQQPFVFTAWFWYIGTLIPVIGVIQVSGQAMADRYTYIPLIGLSVGLVWTIKDRLAGHHSGVAWGVAVSLLLALGVVTNWQTRFWRDDLSLCSRALAVTKNNAVAHQNLGAALELKGDLAQAVEHYRASLQIDKSAEICFNLGNALLKQGDSSEAAIWLAEGLKLRPGDIGANQQLGLVLMLERRYSEAVDPLGRVAKARSSDPQAAFVLANALSEAGREDEARDYYQKVDALDPSLYPKLLDQARKLLASGAADVAEIRLVQATRLKPQDAEAHKLLGMVEAQIGKLAEAVRNLELVTQLQPTADNHYNLGVVLSLAGQHGKAIDSYKAAVSLAPDYAPAANNLAWLLATHPDSSLRNGKEALRLASRNVATHPEEPGYSGTLDAAFAELGRWQEALETAKRTLNLAEKNGNKELAAAAGRRLELYGKHEPYRTNAEGGK